MLHLALVWNVTTAIGGTPYYLRPNFPQNTKYYPLNVSDRTRTLGLRSLRRFILYEHPQQGPPGLDVKELLRLPGDDAEDIEFGSVGELYALIESGIRNIDEKELFIGLAHAANDYRLGALSGSRSRERPCLSSESR
jgi:hypothetical protein